MSNDELKRASLNGEIAGIKDRVYFLLPLCPQIEYEPDRENTQANLHCLRFELENMHSLSIEERALHLAYIVPSCTKATNGFFPDGPISTVRLKGND